MQHASLPSRRILLVDALRGFALLLILLVHNEEHFFYPVYWKYGPAWLDIVDKVVYSVTANVFAGKAEAIFALLFGFTFYMQSSNMAYRGGDFGVRFLWRMLLLVGFAMLNAAFLPGGDMLLLCSALSIVLYITRNWSDKAVLCASVFFLLQPVEWVRCVLCLIDSQCQSSYSYMDYMDMLYNELQYIAQVGGWGRFFLNNITLGPQASFLSALLSGCISQTAGLFLLGSYMGRRQMFLVVDEDRYALRDMIKMNDNKKKWVLLLIASAIAIGPVCALKEPVMLAAKDVPGMAEILGVVLDMWHNLAFTFVLMSSFVLLYCTAWSSKCAVILTVSGRLSLTCYVMQSVLGALIYFPIFFNFAYYFGATCSLLVFLNNFFIQFIFCDIWIMKHNRGPLETIWHKLTWIGSKNDIINNRHIWKSQEESL